MTRNLLAVTHYNRDCNEQIYADLVLTLNSIRLHSTSDVIVVDDGSPVAYQQRIKSMCDIMDIPLITHTENRGVSAAKNTCLNHFMAGDWEYCFLLDDDVEILSDGFEAEYVSSMKNAEVGIVSFNDPDYTSTNPVPVDDLLETSHTCGVCVVVSRECVASVGYYKILPEPWGWEHIEYYCRAAAHGFAKRNVYCDIAGSSNLLRIASHATVFIPEDRQRMSQVNLLASKSQ